MGCSGNGSPHIAVSSGGAISSPLKNLFVMSWTITSLIICPSSPPSIVTHALVLKANRQSQVVCCRKDLRPDKLHMLGGWYAVWNFVMPVRGHDITPLLFFHILNRVVQGIHIVSNANVTSIRQHCVCLVD